MNDVASVQLLPDQTSPPANGEKKDNTVWKIILWIVVGVVGCVVLAVLVLLIYRRARRMIAERRRKQFRRSRRRSR